MQKEMKRIKHGLDDTTCYCRQCSFNEFEGDVARKAKEHCQKTKHTVDIYREHWTEYTFNWRTKLTNPHPHGRE